MFPFLYMGNWYNGCAQKWSMEARGKGPEAKGSREAGESDGPWCSTSGDWDKDPAWGYCNVATQPNFCRLHREKDDSD